MNKEKLYSRIYEFDKIKPMVEDYIKIMKRTKNTKYLFFLRRFCMIIDDPLPLIQDYVFKELFVKEDHDLFLKITYIENTDEFNKSYGQM